MKAFVRRAAREDILRQYRYYLLADAFDAANRFLEAVDNSIGRLVAMPQVGAPQRFRNPALGGLRSWPVKDFEDIHIYYVIRNDVLRVVRVLHRKRDVRTLLEKTD